MEDAIAAFEVAIQLAVNIGDSVAAATCWSNLGAVHEDLGDLEKAQDCYESALSLGEVATNPRRAVEFHLNAAGLRLLTGDHAGARQFVTVARSWAEESQLWWLEADVLLAGSDAHLASGSPEEAWTLLRQAQRTMMGRSYALSNRGRYQRLRRHHIFSSQGLSKLRRITERENLEDQCVQLTGRLEVLAFEDWAKYQSDPTAVTDNSARDELLDRKLLGVIKRLDALGYCV
jgi:tetratricopeptide (TPR) repeat protein